MRSLIAVTTMFTLASTVVFAQSDLRPRITSLVSVLASPREYHDQQVTVIGYVHFEFEGSRLCLRKEDSEAWITSNCFSLDASARSSEERDAAQDSYATVTGTFNASDHGHRGAYQGAFHSLELLAPRQ
jgi:hypothetical protein